jgi:uncharacterized protein involved in outer membrane biogenesis
MRNWLKILLALFSLIIITLLGATLMLPGILRDKGIELVRQKYQRELQIGQISLNLLNLQLEIDQLELKEPDGSTTFISFERLAFSLGLRSLIERALIIDELSLDKPFVRLEKIDQDHFNFSDLLPAAKPAGAETGDPASPFHFSLNNLQILDGKLDFFDHSGAVERTHHIDKLHLAVPVIGNMPYLVERYIQPALSLRIDGSPLMVSGQMKPFDQSVETQLDLNYAGIELPLYAAYLQPFLPFELTDGKLSFHLKLAYRISKSQQPELKLSGNLSLTTLRLKQQGESLFFLPLMLVELEEAAPLTGEYHFSRISFYDPQVQVRRSADGRLNLLDLFPPAKGEAAAEKASPGVAPQVLIANLKLRQGEIVFNDNASPKPKPVAIRGLNIQLTEVQWPQATEIPWQLEGNWSAGGNFSGQGTLQHSPLRVDGEFNLAQLDLTPINNYIPPEIRLSLASASLDTTLAFQLAQEEALSGHISGTLGLHNFSLSGISEELLGWESLQLDGIKVDLKPLDIAIAEVALNNYLAKIRVQRDGQVNLNQIVVNENSEIEAQPAPEVEQNPPLPLPPLLIAELTLQGGEVSFVDRHLPKLFSTSMYKLGGRISGLTSTPGQYANVDLRGVLENQSPLTISGRIAPLAGELDTELKIRFADIDLAPVTPYSGTYLGYSIDKGKLYLDLDYQIAKRQVTARNSIFLDQFTFGEAVASEEATGLPVRLAIALLKDRKGEIHLDLPVSGSTDDPKFGIFSTLMTLLKNLLVKAATSPFSLLASMFGGSDDFSQLSFAPGVTSLTPTDQENLKKVAMMLYERPALNLVLSAFVDPEKDPEGYRQQELKRRVEVEWQKTTTPAADQTISASEYLDNLALVYAQARFPKPRDTFGRLKELPASEMEKLILANILVGEEELNLLARERATAVKNQLVQLNAELKPRIFLKNAEINAPPAKDKTAARVEFGITAD